MVKVGDLLAKKKLLRQRGPTLAAVQPVLVGAQGQPRLLASAVPLTLLREPCGQMPKPSPVAWIRPLFRLASWLEMAPGVRVLVAVVAMVVYFAL